MGIFTIDEYEDLLDELGYAKKHRDVKVKLLETELNLKRAEKAADPEEETPEGNLPTFERDSLQFNDAIRS